MDLHSTGELGDSWFYGPRGGFMSPKKRFSAVAAVTAFFVIATVGIAWADAATDQSISLNAGAASTTSLSVTVTVAVVHCPPGGDLKALEVAFRNSTSDPWTVVHAADTDWPGSDPDGCTSGSPTSSTTDFAWTLASGDSGARTVYARFKHANDEVFAQDDINYTAPPSDTTPPVVTPTISGTLGNNGWYVSDVTVSWTAAGPESPITSTSGCGPTTINYDTAGTTLTCTATSAGGTSSESVTIKRDATAPSISVALDRSPAASGWFNASTGAPVARFTCGDATSGIASCPAEYTFGEGEDQSHTGTRRTYVHRRRHALRPRRLQRDRIRDHGRWCLTVGVNDRWA